MAEKFYHTDLKKEILKIAENSGKYKSFHTEKKIPIPHPTQNFVFHYKPDALLVTRFGKKVIFEILDKQIDDYNLIISDIIQSYLVENISKLIFISKNDNGAKLTKKLSKIIGGRLEENGFFKREIPEVRVYTITYDEVRSGNLNQILKKFSKKDTWG